MQKFPLRMKDNDLLVTELYKDQTGAVVTALSVYLAPKTGLYAVPVRPHGTHTPNSELFAFVIRVVSLCNCH